jgi:UDP-N-acetylglucosamine--N-acetylmuramyl-(pentapeptide) pyrophosphoryl-undecaprenol N-acetylglucosamine transferase
VSTLLVASAGGHLKQLHRLVPRLDGLEQPFVWVTYPTSQSESLLAGEPVIHGHPVDSRDYPGVARNAWLAARVMRGRRFSRVVTTGSAIALGFLPVARLMGLPCHYIESAARSTGPSQTGRMLRRLPGVRLYTQYSGWATPPWRYLGSVFDAFEAHARADPAGSMRRVVVCLGTSEQYGFPRLVRRMVEILPSSAEVLWQIGMTDVDGLGIAARRFVPAAELDGAIAAADVVVTHAGTGAALSALEAGKVPVLVPRSRAHGENVDDHQALISAELARRGLAVDARPDTLSLTELAAAMRRRVIQRPDPPRLRLAED